jgi:hypothetical protein
MTQRGKGLRENKCKVSQINIGYYLFFKYTTGRKNSLSCMVMQKIRLNMRKVFYKIGKLDLICDRFHMYVSSYHSWPMIFPPWEGSRSQRLNMCKCTEQFILISKKNNQASEIMFTSRSYWSLAKYVRSAFRV